MGIKKLTTMYALLLKAKEKYGSSIAVRNESEEISYDELFDTVLKLACSCQKNGLYGKKAELYAELSVEWIIAYLALVTAGVTVILHEPDLVTEVLEDEVCWSGRAKDLISNQVTEEYGIFQQPEGDKTATIVYTSGTTGKPKGVMLTQKNIVQDTLLAYFRFGSGNLKEGDITIPVLPVHHMYGITASILVSVCAGTTMYILEDTKYLMKRMADIKPKVLYLVPMIVRTIYERMQLLIKDGKVSRNSLKASVFGENIDMIVSGGAPLDVKMIDFFESIGIHLLNGYGITECSPVITVLDKQNNKKGSVGRVTGIDNVKVKIVNDTVHVWGDIVMKGYTDGSEDAFYYENGERWFDTKDIGYIDEDGYLFITGRKKNLIILEDGNNISPEEMESYFNEFDIVLESLIYVNTKSAVSALGVYLRLNETVLSDLTKKEIEEKVQEVVETVNEKVPFYKKVRFWTIAEKEFPKNKGGKILRDEVSANGENYKVPFGISGH